MVREDRCTVSVSDFALPTWVYSTQGRLIPFDPDRISLSLFDATEQQMRPSDFVDHLGYAWKSTHIQRYELSYPARVNEPFRSSDSALNPRGPPRPSTAAEYNN